MTLKEFKVENLAIKIFVSREEMGQFAASEVASKIKELQKIQSEVRIIFAAAPSQNEFLESIIGKKEIDWKRVVAFHMDEYVGLSPDAPQGFGNFLKERIFDRVQFKGVHLLNGGCENLEKECKRYTDLLKMEPIDIVCMGIGENGHIAFNDPPVADFNDSSWVKIVKLDEVCRQQQVNDGCFSKFDEVPIKAITLSVPALMSGKSLFCMVPSKTKAQAVKNTLKGPVEEKCPASILRRHSSAKLYLDAESSSLLKG